MDNAINSENLVAAPDAEAVTAVGTAGRQASHSPGQSVHMAVRASRMLSESVLQLTLARKDGGRLPFKPGQFCSIAIPGAQETVERSYSIATRVDEPAQNAIYEIAVSPVRGGVATRYLFSRRVGDSVSVTGPFGRLVFPSEEPARYVLVGTGTGVAPYRAMLPELRRRALNSPVRAVLAMGVRARRELIYADEFQDFARRHPWFRFIACYSREALTALHSYERFGRVQVVQSELHLEPGQDRIYLCGHPDMIDDWTRQLKADGFDKRDIVRERYVSPKPRRRPSRSVAHPR